MKDIWRELFIFWFGSGHFGGKWPRGFQYVLVLALCAKRISADLRAKREKKKSAGAENTERSPERATLLNQVFEKASRKAKP